MFPPEWLHGTVFQSAIDNLLRRPPPLLQEIPLSLNVLGLALIPTAFFARRHRGLALFAFVLGALTLLFSLGPNTSFFELYRKLPLLSMFRAPQRVLFVTDFCIAVLVGVGLDAILRCKRPGSKRDHLAWAIARPFSTRSVGLIALPIVLAVVIGALVVPAGAYVSCTVLVIAASTILAARFSRPRPGKPKLVAAILAALLIVELFFAWPNRFRLPYTPRDVLAYDAFHPVYKEIASSGQRVLLHNRGWFPALPPKAGSVFRMKSVDDYEPLNSKRQGEYFMYLLSRTVNVWHKLPFLGRLGALTSPLYLESLQERGRLLDLASVRFFLMPREALSSLRLRNYLRSSGMREVKERKFTGVMERTLVLFENPNAIPRAYTVYQVRPSPPVKKLLSLISRRSYDPLVVSYAEGDTGLVETPEPPRRGAPAHVIVDKQQIVEVEAKLQEPGLLVLADSFYPGWHATVDGQPAPILAVNHLFRGVPVPEGEHRVRFEYRPWTFTAGAAGSLGGLAILVILLWKKKKRSGSGADQA
jgi:hypothetical protein